MEQKRQLYSLMSTMQKYRQHHLFQPGPSNQTGNVYPDFNYNPPPRLPSPQAVRSSPVRSPSRVPPPAANRHAYAPRDSPPSHALLDQNLDPQIQQENSSRETESIHNEEHNHELASSTYQSGSKFGTQKSHAYGSRLRNEFETTQSSAVEAVQDLPTRDTATFSQSNAQFHEEVLMELCNSKYDYIPRDEKVNLVEEILMENETQYMESQLTVPQFVKILLQRFEVAQSRRKRNEYLALKRGLSSRETYSRLIRQKKDSKSNSSLNQ